MSIRPNPAFQYGQTKEKEWAWECNDVDTCQAPRWVNLIEMGKGQVDKRGTVIG